jgi:putative ABC transport system substrate-binding protein
MKAPPPALTVILTIAVLAGPLAVKAQRAAIPVVGYLGSGSPGPSAFLLAAFRQGLKEAGYVEGANVAIEFRWAEGRYERLPTLASELVRRQVVVIAAAGGNGPALAAKAATTAIPIVFISGGDPIKAGLVASFNRPGANITGVNTIFTQLVPKRLDLLRQVVPRATRIAALVNPDYPDVDLQRRELQEAGGTMRQRIRVVTASTERDIDATLADLVEQKTDALLVANDPFFVSRRDHIVGVVARYKIPAIYSAREFADSGGLMSYGPNFRDAWRQGGSYVGRILGGAKPADLPVLQPTKFELVINFRTAKALGLTIPPSVLLQADEVIEQ